MHMYYLCYLHVNLAVKPANEIGVLWGPKRAHGSVEWATAGVSKMWPVLGRSWG